MKNTSILLAFICLLMLSACEEVIQLELDTADQRVVTEANLNATEGRCTVSLSKSGGFYELSNFEAVEDASVVLTLASGPEILLNDLGNGQYSAENLSILPGETAGIQINLPSGEVIEAGNIQTPGLATIDSLIIQKSAPGGGGGPGGPPPSGGSEENFVLSVKWKDLLGEDNYYRLKIYRNGAFQSGTYILADDRLGDGVEIMRPILRESYAMGDTLRVQLLTTSKGYYAYFTDLANSDGRGFSSPTPYNPKSNLSGDALGYFGIWQVSEKTIIVR